MIQYNKFHLEKV